MRQLLLAFLLFTAPLFAQNPVTPPWPGAVPTETNYGVFYDRAYSALTVDMTATTGTITVADGSRFPDEPFWVTVGPITQCSVGRPATDCETIFITGVTGNVLTIGATGRQITAACTGTATGGANPTHSIGEVIVQAIPACLMNALSAQVMSLADGMFVTHATDCTALTGTLPGQRCHELDDDTNYVWDGAAWDQFGGTGAFLPLTGGELVSGSSTNLTVTEGPTQSGNLFEVRGAALDPWFYIADDAYPYTVGDYRWYSLSAFTGEITHANSANRSWAFPNASGTVALTSDVPGLANNRTVEDEGTPLTQRAVINCVGSGITCADVGGETEINVPGGGGASDMIGVFNSPTERTLSGGTATFTAIAQTIDTEGDAASDDWTGATCAAGVSFSVRAANDARSIVIVSSSIPTPTDSDLTLDQDGDLAFVICQAANTPEVILFFDEDGQTIYNINSSMVPTLTTVQQAGRAKFTFLRHADNCTTLVDGIDGQACWEKDANNLYVCESPEGDGGACDAAGEWTVLSAAATEVNNLETITTGIVDDEVFVGNATDDGVYVLLPDCDNATTSKLLYDQATNTFSCGTDQTGGGGGGLTSLLDSESQTAASCTNQASYTTMATLTIASGALAVGDEFELNSLYTNTCATGPPCQTDITVNYGSANHSITDLIHGQESSISARCIVTSATTMICRELYVEDAVDNDQVLSYTMNNFTSASNDFLIQHKSCDTIDSLTLERAWITKTDLTP